MQQQLEAFAADEAAICHVGARAGICDPSDKFDVADQEGRQKRLRAIAQERDALSLAEPAAQQAPVFASVSTERAPTSPGQPVNGLVSTQNHGNAPPKVASVTVSTPYTVRPTSSRSRTRIAGS